jgi:acetyl esterase/lipase
MGALRRVSWPFVFILGVWAVMTAVAAAQAAKVPVRVERNLVYGKGGGRDLQLDLAMPAEGTGPFPAIVCIHGGAWRAGRRQDVGNTTQELAAAGCVAVTVEYRLTPDSKFPAQIEDCKAAVRWLRANAQRYHINPERIGAIGTSAGGHLACLLGLTKKTDGLEGNGGNPDQSSAVQAVVSFSGPTDLYTKSLSENLDPMLIPLAGASRKDRPDLYRRMSPITYVTKEAPPFLFFHGAADPLVSVQHARVLAQKLKEVGVEAQLVELEGEGHNWGGQKLAQNLAQAVRFFDQHLKK